jgi:hypothetical protein
MTRYLCNHPGCTTPVRGINQPCSRHLPPPPIKHRLILYREDLVPEAQGKPNTAITVDDFTLESFCRALGAEEIIFRDFQAEVDRRIDPTDVRRRFAHGRTS